MNCKDAISKAKRLAESANEPYTVWRCGDEFAVMLEDARRAAGFKRSTLPIRPVATYDPDGSEHA